MKAIQETSSIHLSHSCALMATYWPLYPSALVTDLATTFKVFDGLHVDLGCGVGLLTYPFTRYAHRVIGVDKDKEVLAYAQMHGEVPTGALATPLWVHARAEECVIEESPVRLITIGRSFHEMEQKEVLDRSFLLLEVGGGVAIVNDETIAPFQNDLLWHHAIRETLKEFSVSLLHNNMTLESLSQSHKDALASSAFVDHSTRVYRRRREWDTDSVVGYLKTQKAIQALSNEKQKELLSTLTNRLISIEGDASLKEEIEYQVLTGVKR